MATDAVLPRSAATPLSTWDRARGPDARGVTRRWAPRTRYSPGRGRGGEGEGGPREGTERRESLGLGRTKALRVFLNPLRARGRLPWVVADLTP